MYCTVQIEEPNLPWNYDGALPLAPEKNTLEIDKAQCTPDGQEMKDR